MTRLRRHGPALAALALLHLSALALLLARGEGGVPLAVIPYDFRSQYAPWSVYAGQLLRAGTWPLWCPWAAAGTPFYLNPQSQLYWPPAWITAAFGGGVHAVQVQLVLTVLAGGIGAYALAGRLFGGRAAALVAAIAYDLCTAVLGHAEHMTAINAYAVAPWLFYFVLRDRPLGIAACTALLITGGYPAAWMMTLGWAAVLAAGLAYRAQDRRVAFRAATAFGLGVVLSAVHWLPIALHLGDVARGASLPLQQTLLGNANLSFRHVWAPIFQWTMLTPLPGPAPDPSMNGFYTGALCLPLAAVALFHRKDGVVRPLALFTFATFLLACGGLFFGRTALHLLVPIFRLSRVPAEDSAFLSSLGLALLAGAGAQTLAAGDGAVLATLRRGCVALIGVLCAGLVGFHFVYGERAWERVILPFTSAELLFVCAALVAVLLLEGRARSIALCVALALELGTSVVAGFPLLGTGVDAAEWEQLSSQRTESDPEQPRVAHGDPRAIDESSSAAYLRHTFYLSDYNPTRLRRLDALLDAGFGEFLAHPARRRVVAIPKGTDLASGTDLVSRAEQVEYRITSYEANGVTYAVRLPKPARLVFNEVAFSGWWAAVDDAPEAAMIEVGGGLRALDVEAGDHLIATRFSPPEAPAALALSAIGVLLALLWSTRLRKRAH